MPTAHYKKSGGRKTASKRADVTFPVGRIRRFLREGKFADRVGSAAPVYLAAVLEYLVSEILDLGGNVTQDENKKRITPRHVMFAVRYDQELNTLLKNVTFPWAGIAPPKRPKKKIAAKKA